MRNLLLIAGAVLVVLSAIALVNQGFSYTREEQIIDVGPIQATAETRETMEIPLALSLGGLAVGVVLIVGGVRQKS